MKTAIREEVEIGKVQSWSHIVITQWWRLQYESCKTINYVRKGDSRLWRSPAKRKRRHSGRMSNINESQDHERTFSEESRDEMETEKPR